MTANTTPAGYPRNQALHVMMPDGKRLGLDVWLPGGLEVGQRVPTLMRATRYWRARGFTNRSLEVDANFATAERLNGAGYAYVIVDARGTGASFGVWTRSWSNQEVADYGEVVRWIGGQAWSNGKVATFGISYDANTSELTAIGNPPPLKAVVPRFSDFDVYLQLLFPGGIFFDWFARNWGNGNQLLDSNDICGLMHVEGEACEELKRTVTGVKPVDDDVDGSLLAAAVREHAGNADTYAIRQHVTFKDDTMPPDNETMAGMIVPAHRAAIERAGVAYQAWASWLDAGTQLGVLSRYNTFRNPQQVIIGAWSHGARYDADPFVIHEAPPELDVSEQFARMLEFVGPLLETGTAIPTPPARSISYYTLGEGAWKTTEVWPPAGFAMQRWYFGVDGSLGQEAPSEGTGADEYTVDFTATTGQDNRWHTQLGGAPVVYPDRAGECAQLLCYRSAPLERDTEITGHPVVFLAASSTHEDGAFHVYLEDVAPDGRVTYITEGMLRALHRRVSGARPAAAVFGPFHTYRRSDAEALVPGEVAELTFDLFPTSVLIRRGHRVQVSLAGHDADNFARIPEEGTPTITVQRNRLRASWIDLPMAEG